MNLPTAMTLPSIRRAAALVFLTFAFSLAARAQSFNRTFKVASSEGDTVLQMQFAAADQILPSARTLYQLGFWFNAQQLPATLLQVGTKVSSFANIDRRFVIGANPGGGLSVTAQFDGLYSYHSFGFVGAAVTSGNWHYLFVQVNQDIAANPNIIVWLDGVRSGVNLDYTDARLFFLPQGYHQQVLLGGASGVDDRPVADASVRFHSFSLWRPDTLPDAATIATFNNTDVFLQGPGAFEALGANPANPTNQTLLNNLLYYSTFDGNIDASPPGPPYTGPLWRPVVSGTFETAPSVRYLTVTQNFQGVPANVAISVEPTAARSAVAPLLQPSLDTTKLPVGSRISFSAPEFIYVDRFGQTLIPPPGAVVPSAAAIGEKAVARWRTLGYTVVGTTISGTDRAVDLVIQNDITFEWQFQKEVALIVDSAVPGELGSTAAGNPQPAVNKYWYPVGGAPATPPRIEGAVLVPDSANDVRYRIRGYELQNPSQRPAGRITPAGAKFIRFPGFATAGSTVGAALSSDAGISTSFWLRPGTQTAGILVEADRFQFVENAGRLEISFAGIAVGNLPLRPDRWDHWCGTYDPAGPGTVTIFLNGVAKLAVEIGASAAPASAFVNLETGAGGMDFDEFRVWNRALDSVSVLDSMHVTNLPAEIQQGLRLNASFDSDATYNASAKRLRYQYSILQIQLNPPFPGFLATDTAATAIADFNADYHPPVDRLFVPVASAADPQVPAFVLDDFAVVRWHWQKEFKIENLSVNGNFDSALSTVSGKSGSTDTAGVLWVKEDDSVEIKAKRAADTDTLEGLLGTPTGLLENVTYSRNGGLGLANTIAASQLSDASTGAEIGIRSESVNKPARIIWNYGETIYDVEVALGQGIDPANQPILGGGNLSAFDLSRNAAQPAQVTQLIRDNPTDAAVSNAVRWDAVKRVLYPIRPGQALLSWPTADGSQTKLIRLIAGFPNDEYRFDNGTTRTFPAVAESFPGSPGAHYEAVFNSETDARANLTAPPIELDSDPADAWFFNANDGLAYSERVSTTPLADPTQRPPLAATALDAQKTLRITEPSRSVLVFSKRPDPAESAAGDLLREELVVRVVEGADQNAVRATPFADPSDTGKAASFDGTTAVAISGAPLFANGMATFDFWAKSAPEGGVLFSNGRAAAAGGTEFGFRQVAGALNFYLVVLGEFLDVPVDGEWHHWAVTSQRLQPDTGQGFAALQIYRDGLAVAAATGTTYSGTAAWTLGSTAAGGFVGELDDFHAWNAALTAPEIRAAMLDSSPDFTRGGFTDRPRVELRFESLPLAQTGSLTTATASGGVLTRGSDGIPEVATRISSRLDLAGYGTGYITNLVANYNSSLYNRGAGSGGWGPVFPVNSSLSGAPGAAPPDIVWYRNPARFDAAGIHPNVAWPYVKLEYPSVRFPTEGPHKDKRIYISSRIGSEGVDENGNQQTVFDPARYTGLSLYNQPDKDQTGYNPNEEHALVAPSVRESIGNAPATNNPPPAVFALRDDLNLTDPATNYTSEPWVLAQYLDGETGRREMIAWKVEETRNEAVAQTFNIERRTALYPQLNYSKSDFASFLKPLAAQPANPTYDFHYPIFAGDPLAFPYPLNIVIGAVVPPQTTVTPQADGRRVFWKDHKGNPWIVSGREPSVAAAPPYDAMFEGRFWYPLRADFWYDLNNDGVVDEPPGTPVAWLPDSDGKARPVRYEAFWKNDYPVLKSGETLTYAGGEYKADKPASKGLPGVVGWAAAQVVFDTKSPDMTPIPAGGATDRYSARVIRPLDEYMVNLSAGSEVPARLQPAAGNVVVRGTKWYFSELSAALQNRIYYDSVSGKLVLRGLLDDKDIGDSALTFTSDALHLLLPNALTPAEHDALLALDGATSTAWDGAVDELYNLSRNPEGIALRGGTGADKATGGLLYYRGLMQKIERDAQMNFVFGPEDPGTGIAELSRIRTSAEPLISLGAGSAVITNPELFTNPGFFDEGPAYVTLAENNHPDLGDAPVSLSVIRISPQRYRGGVKAILPPNAFDEKITLRHTADFGGAIDNMVYEWYLQEVDGGIPTETPDSSMNWTIAAGENGPSFDLVGLPERLLGDNWVFARYRHVDEVGFRAAPEDLIGPESAWLKATATAPAPYQWAGAANSPQIVADGSLRYIPALAAGWVKRVLDRVNPYEARIDDFYNNSSPATYTSMIEQAGARPLGPVALNSDKNVIENVGLIALYQTVLDRAFALASATNASGNSVQQALLLAATRISDFYQLLGDEAYSDALDPTIGLGTGSVAYGKFAPSVWSFRNQEPSLLTEELALLRGTDFAKSWPVDNRLFWNFTKGEGEAAYASNYQISDVNQDGFINEEDAAKLFPQGHGDAWGQYTSALRTHYKLLQSSFFKWRTRAEFYNLADNVLEVDYLDERKFAEKAAARAKAGAVIVRDTYREAYTANPDGQWQGYTDVDPARSWGVKGWGKRAGQGAYFDWLTANSLLPAETLDENAEGLDVLDRSSVTAVGEIAAAAEEIQATLDDATLGVTPVGVGEDSVPFDIDPTRLDRGQSITATHFEQIYERAVAALSNSVAALDYANEADQRLRQVATTTQQFVDQAYDQDQSFRNRLKKIFGSPYAGTIGAGKLYPAGYQGPDLFLWQYVDKTSAGDYLPPESGEFRDLLRNDSSGDVSTVSKRFENVYEVPEASATLAGFFRTYLNRTFSDFRPDSEGKVQFPPTATGAEIDATLRGRTFAAGTDLDTLFANFELPVYTNATYGFRSPDSWGGRAVTGEMQSQIAATIGAQLALLKAVDDYQAYLRELTVQLDAILDKQEVLLSQAKSGDSLFVAKQTFEAIKLATSSSKRLIEGLKDTNNNLTKTLITAIPDEIGSSVDALAPAQAAFYALYASTTSGFDAAQLGLDVAFGAADQIFATIEGVYKIYDDVLDDKKEIIAAVIALQEKVNGESTQRFAIASALSQLDQQQQALSRKIGEGSALLDERMTSNQRIASNVQRERYNDMTLRVAHNDALQKYRDSFDLAAKYTYLAAKAYAYETNLSDGHPANATGILTDIVSARLPGALEAGAPLANGGGLSEILAKLKANYTNLNGALGFNNPQTETGRFSLRRELFRVKKPAAGDSSAAALASDRRWRQALGGAQAPNLWNVPEFREYCRPPWTEAEGAQPGLVIPFESEIFDGKNFFGWPLAGGDQSYDASLFSTKIRSVGVWFEGYDGQNLAVAPRVWLVPAGNDIMRISNSYNLETRAWSVVDQAIPTPYAINGSNLTDRGFISGISNLTEPYGATRKFSRFRAYHDDGGDFFSDDELSWDSRLAGRSVWNTKWLLIVPGSTLSADGNAGLRKLIGGEETPGIRDIRLIFKTYSASGN